MQTAQPTEAESAPRPLPVWMSIPIILLCLLGGGWIIHWYVTTDPLSHEARILGDAPTQAQWQGAGRASRNGVAVNNQRRFIRDRGDGRWGIHTEEASADVAVVNAKLSWRSITYNNFSFVPADVIGTILTARSIAHDDTRIAVLKMTPEQVKKLRQLTPYITMAISEADKSQLAAEILAYVQSADSARGVLEPKLLQNVEDIALKSKPATRQQAIARAAQINAIITPQQWKQNTAMGGMPK